MSWKFGEVILARRKLGYYNKERQYVRSLELDRFISLWAVHGTVMAISEEVFLKVLKETSLKKELSRKKAYQLFKGYAYTYPAGYFRSERVHVEGLRGLL